MPKTYKPKKWKPSGDPIKRPGALHQQIAAELTVKPSTRVKFRKTKKNVDYVDSDLSSKILDQAKKQQEELEDQIDGGIKNSFSSRLDFPGSMDARSPGADGGSSEGDEISDNGDVNDDGELEQLSDHADTRMDQSDITTWRWFASACGTDVDGEDGATSDGVKRSVDSFDLSEERQEVATMLTDDINRVLHPEAIDFAKQHVPLLRNYRSGPLPKFIKILPSYDTWEEYLHILQPDEWSAASVYAITKIFCSNLSKNLAQRFYSIILLPRIRDDIREYKRLNFHLMEALKKALFKPSAFFKGIILPLCEAGDCTLREASILCSVLREHRIPYHHSGTAIIFIARLPYSGANSVFLRTLLDKKYALPYTVVDEVVQHFLRVQATDNHLPVLCQQCLLTFVQRYKRDLAKEQKEELLRLAVTHHHPEISPEVQRELECCTELSR